MEEKHSRSVEDYIEVIYKLVREKGYARVSDISLALKVQPPSVTEMLKKMYEQGLVVYERYRTIKLSEKGEELAKKVLRKHEILFDFLILLGIDEKKAEEDACRAEHFFHPETIMRIKILTEILKSTTSGSKLLSKFWFLCKNESKPL